MKIAVIYKSKYGTTKRYAKWISEELNADLFENNNLKADTFLDYDVIVYGGGLYAGGTSGLDFITKNYNMLKGKKLIVFTCGLADPNILENKEAILRNTVRTFNDDMKDNIKIFNLRGGIDYKKLSVIHKTMMYMLKKSISKKEELTPENNEFLETYGKVVDFTDKGSIKPILDYIKK